MLKCQCNITLSIIDLDCAMIRKYPVSCPWGRNITSVVLWSNFISQDSCSSLLCKFTIPYGWQSPIYIPYFHPNEEHRKLHWIISVLYAELSCNEDVETEIWQWNSRNLREYVKEHYRNENIVLVYLPYQISSVFQCSDGDGLLWQYITLRMSYV